MEPRGCRAAPGAQHVRRCSCRRRGCSASPVLCQRRASLPLRDFLSDDESEKRNVQSSDDSFEPYPEKK